jgi:integrase
MARQTRGAIVEHTGLDGRTYRALRFHGVRQAPVRVARTGVARRRRERPAARASRPRARHLAAAHERRGPAEPEPVPTFHEYAEQWWIRNERQLAASTRVDYRWRLERHLLPFVADYSLDRITFDLVERYIAVKLAEDEPLAPRSINMTLTLMAAILEGAVERELIPRNPAKGKHRRVRERARRRTYLDTSEQIEALLAAAGELDAEARRDRRHVSRRAILATLMFAGLRIGELCALRWRDVDLATGWLHVGEAKTDAGCRRVEIRGTLRDELAEVRARPQSYLWGQREPALLRRWSSPSPARTTTWGRPEPARRRFRRAGRASRRSLRSKALQTCATDRGRSRRPPPQLPRWPRKLPPVRQPGSTRQPKR